MSLSLRALPLGMFGAVMGIAGLGLASRGAAPLGWPALLAEAWVLLGALVGTALVCAYAVKAIRHHDALRAELDNPATAGFCAALPVGLTLVAGGLEPYAPLAGRGLWLAAAVLLVALQAYVLSRWLRGGVEAGQVNGGWMILFVGGIVFPSSGIPLGLAEPAAWFFIGSAAAVPFVMGAVAWRTVFGPPLPPPLRPTSFILLVPPALVYVNGLALGQAPVFLEGLYFAGLVLAAGLLLASRDVLGWPFGPPWWALTFPLDALATAGARYAAAHPVPWAKALALALLALATAAVVFVLVRTVRALAAGTLLGSAAQAKGTA